MSAGPSSSSHDESELDALSLQLARQLQEEEDMAAATAFAAQDEVRSTPVRGAGCSSSGESCLLHIPLEGMQTPAGALPVERLASAAHKQVTHLGRNTAKKIQTKFSIGPSTRDFLQLVNGPKHTEVLAMIDVGQRSRVEAEIVALTVDLLPSE